MIKILFTALVVISLMVSAEEVETVKIVYDVPESVEVKKQQNDFVSFHWGGGNVMIVYPFPVAISKDMLPEYADRMMEGFRKQIAKTEGLKIVKRERNKLKIGAFEGFELSFVLDSTEAKASVYQKMYLLRSGDSTYNGQLTCIDNKQLEVANKILDSSKVKP